LYICHTQRYSPSRDHSRSITPPHWRREINRTVRLSDLNVANVSDDKPKDEKWAKGDMLNSVENISPRRRKRQRDDEQIEDRKQRKRCVCVFVHSVFGCQNFGTIFKKVLMHVK